MGAVLMDTNVLSEWSKPRPNSAVDRWAESGPDDVFISVITLDEISYGIEHDGDADRSGRTRRWLEDLVFPEFGDRFLDVTESIATASGRLRAMERRAGRVLSVPDALIAATAIVHGLTLATRNTRDFASLGISLVNPWEWQAP